MGCFLQNCTPYSYCTGDMLPTATCTWDAVQYTRIYMQQRASVEFCWASPRAMPCHSAHPTHPIGISKYPSPIVRPQFCSQLLFITVLLLRIQWLITERRKGELENEERGGWTVMDPHIPTLLVGDKPSTRDGVSSYEMRFATLFLFSCYCPAPPRASLEKCCLSM